MIAFAKKFYITTTIPYANAPPHIGFALEIIQADVLARWHTQFGEDVFFLTGTDEHGVKNYQTAKKEGLSTKAFVDRNSAYFKDLAKILNISNSYFIRTTDKKVHWPGVLKIWRILTKNGDIYKKEYSGNYCSGCERFVLDRELVEGICPDHPNIRIEHISEENYFFKLSKYSDKIRKLVKTDKLKIVPSTWKNDFLSLIKNGLQDVSFSRAKEHLPWGIPVPNDSSQVMYVWCDALTNYLTGIGFPNVRYKKYWPADVHVVGKDMLRFHAGIWPGMLLSAGLPLPKELAVHGFITSESKKMSKSLGNVVDPFVEVKKYGIDAVRYFLIREIPTGEDGDYSQEAIIARTNNELANELGNLVSRSLTLISKFADNKVPKGKFKLKYDFDKINKLVEARELNKALDEIWKFVQSVNIYIQEKQPWTKPKGLGDVLYNLAESLRIISALVWPFIPESAERIAKQLGIKVPKFADLTKPIKAGTKIKKGEILFKKVEFKEEVSHPSEKANVRVGKIIEVEDFPEATKPLYKIYADFGKLGKKQTAARLKPYLTKNELKGKLILAVINLPSRDIAGFKSEFLILAAVDKSYLKDAASGCQPCTKAEINSQPDATKDTKEGLELLYPESSKPGDRAYLEGFEGEPAKQISFKEFEKIRLKVGDNKQIIADGKILRTNSEVIKVKRMREGAKVC